MSRKARKFKAFFRPKLGDLQTKKKKKKKKKVFAKIQSDFSAEIRNSKLFSAQNQVISKNKKKKRSSPKFRVIFRPNSEFRNSKLFSAQNQVIPPKKKKKMKVRSVFHPNSLKFPAESLVPNLQRGGPCLNFAHFTMQFCNPSDPKGGAMAQWPPLNTPLQATILFQQNLA